MMGSVGAQQRKDGRDEIGRRVGANVRHLRRRLDFSQEEVAWRASLHRDAIFKIENGQRRPRVDTLLKLAAALEVDPDELLAGIDWVSPTESQRWGAFAFTHPWDLARTRRVQRG